MPFNWFSVKANLEHIDFKAKYFQEHPPALRNALPVQKQKLYTERVHSQDKIDYALALMWILDYLYAIQLAIVYTEFVTIAAYRIHSFFRVYTAARMNKGAAALFTFPF